MKKVVPLRQARQTVAVLTLTAIAAGWWWHQVAFICLAIGLIAAMLLSPPTTIAIHNGWTWLGKRMGMLSGTVLLSIVYLVIILPTALIFRKKMRAALRRRSTSYFHIKDHLYAPGDLEHPW